MFVRGGRLGKQESSLWNGNGSRSMLRGYSRRLLTERIRPSVACVSRSGPGVRYFWPGTPLIRSVRLGSLLGQGRGFFVLRGEPPECRGFQLPRSECREPAAQPVCADWP